MATPRLSNATLDELARRHREFLHERLSAPENGKEWVRAVRDAYQRTLDRPLREVVEPARLTDALLRAIPPAALRSFASPLAREIARRLASAARDASAPVGDHVPERARRAIDELVSRPDFVPERLVRKVLEQEAVENALRDVLYDGLREFNDTVNPFFAEWGLPALLSWLPVGGSAVAASMGKLRAEFDRRLEPELRKFLLVFSRQASGRLADVFLAKSNDPSLLALRRNLVEFVYGESVSALTEGLDEQALDRAADAVEASLERALTAGTLRRAILAELEAFVAEHGERTLGEWLESIGAGGDPAVEAWAELVWPQVEDLLRGAAVRELADKLTDEFYAGLRT